MTEEKKRGRYRGVLLFLLVLALAAGAVLSIYTGALPPNAGIVAVALVLLTLFWLLRAHLPRILLVFFAVLLIGAAVTRRLPKLRADALDASESENLARKWATSGRFNETLPIVVHLIFDEMMSPGGFTNDIPGGAEMRESLLRFGEKHSLRMFDSVYSRYFFSGESMPNMMSPEYLGKTGLGDIYKSQQASQVSNAYFDDLDKRGYRTVVFQTSLMNFCANKSVDMCETFDSFDPGGKGEVGLDARTQRASVWQTIVRAYKPSYVSEVGQWLLGRVYGLKHEVGVFGTADRYDAQRFPQWFDRFKKFTATVPRGSHVYAHFMVPHSPYLLSEGCVVSGRFEAGYYLSQYPADERAAKRQQYYRDYFAQLSCVQRKLDEFLTELRQAENFRDATIVIHGDHGSRISSGNILEDYKPRDYVDNYAVFFAARSPKLQPGLDCEFVSLPEIFRRQFVADAPRTAARLPVVVTSRAAGLAKVESPMPMFGCAAGTSALASR
ncbi:MAG TPA: sulfatase-like hydrolase/transferase [Vicinamibacterales bacterium]|nr:sulfatase-like hydrolase/transferase [Vicinamibacterales bacterium]